MRGIDYVTVYLQEVNPDKNSKDDSVSLSADASALLGR